MMARVAGAKVIVLESHPAWISAQQLARERSESMRRHPSFQSRASVAIDEYRRHTRTHICMVTTGPE